MKLHSIPSFQIECAVQVENLVYHHASLYLWAH